MSNPQQPEQRRSHNGGATPQHSGEFKARQTDDKGGGHAHGTDEGGGEGSVVPLNQRPAHR
ncbi:hypothetical protein ACWCQN_43900 [Streptomyces sp. NPDC001984]